MFTPADTRKQTDKSCRVTADGGSEASHRLRAELSVATAAGIHATLCLLKSPITVKIDTSHKH